MSVVQVQCKALFDFYDYRQTDGGDVTAITSFAGEELGLALFQHYLNKATGDAKLLDGIPKAKLGNRKGYHLDAWVKSNDNLYQVEVKNWAANSFGGREYDGNYLAGWEQFTRWFRDAGLQKVLYPMESPESYCKLARQPVACMWPIMHNQDLKHPFFVVPVNDLQPLPFETHFKELYIFSMATYLRYINSPTIDLNMPKTATRLQKIRSLFVPYEEK